jgi:hypothetical protein
MHTARRHVLKSLAGAAGLALSPLPSAEAQVERAMRGMPAPRIKDIQVIGCGEE